MKTYISILKFIFLVILGVIAFILLICEAETTKQMVLTRLIAGGLIIIIILLTRKEK